MNKEEYYQQDLCRFYRFNIPPRSSILQIGIDGGQILNNLKPSFGVYVDLFGKSVRSFKKRYPKLNFVKAVNEKIKIKQKFSYIIIPDAISQIKDIQKIFQSLKKNCKAETRLIINYFNFFWLPFFKLAEKLGLKRETKDANWLNEQDLTNFLHLADFEIIKTGKRFLFPFYLPLLSSFINRYLAQLPLINKLCITNYLIARPLINPKNKLLTVSIIIPARNEKGNIENIVKKLPKLGKKMEIIFVEGHSLDKTYEEIIRVAHKYHHLNIRYTKQKEIGKGDAVRKGFAMAKGELLIIFDADLTIEPKELIKFYEALVKNKGEFINGSRLVYPLESGAMKTLNIFGNKFFSVIFSWFLGQNIKDTLCGTKAISKKNYEKIAANRSYFGNFDPFGDFDLIFGSAKLNLKFCEIPVRYLARKYGQTNISRFKHGWLLLKMTLFAMNKIKFI